MAQSLIAAILAQYGRNMGAIWAQFGKLFGRPQLFSGVFVSRCNALKE
jgi:hypothetical protein